MPNNLCKHVGGLCALLWLFTLVASVEAQRVTLTTTVSETVVISVPPHFNRGNIDINVVSSGSTVRMTLTGKGADSGVIRVPLLVRSNSGFKISGNYESNTAALTQLSVTDVRATGRLVSSEAVNNVEIPQQFDRRGPRENVASESLDLTGPFVLLSGPRVSLGGTLNSSNNALQITLLIRVEPTSVGGWLAHLTFSNH
jgi:hypothetical protein